jgi:predicted Zn-dependent protease with MMP-like domain
MNPASLRKILGSALAAFAVAVGIVTLVAGYSSDTAVKLVQFLAVVGLGVVVIGGVIVLALVQLGDWHSPTSDDAFDEIVRRAEAMGAGEPWESPWDSHDDYGEFDADLDDDFGLDVADEEQFKALVRSALDELPLEFHRALEHVAIVVSDGGATVRTGRGRRGAYGIYQGDTVARDYFHDRIVIFRDTLVRDFGHDPDLLRAQVVRTVRHELAHHLGWDERGVRDLGL